MPLRLRWHDSLMTENVLVIITIIVITIVIIGDSGLQLLHYYYYSFEVANVWRCH